MFDRIGETIQDISKIILALGILGSFIFGIMTINLDNEYSFLGVVLIFLGTIITFISSLILYGFGEIIKKICKIEKILHNQNNSMD